MNFQRLYDNGSQAERREFERRHALCLRIAIGIKVVLLTVLMVAFT